MNRTFDYVFHSPVQSSFAMPVNVMWKLCKAGKKSEARLSYTPVSAKFGTDF
jgi:hypothetical protein